MTGKPTASPPRAHRIAGAAARVRRRLVRPGLLLLFGVLAALLVSCSSSGKGLIPSSDAGPLQGDFEAVAQAAETGDGDCSKTESALLKTEQDFAALPSSLDSGLRETLHRGIENLRTRSLALCVQPLPQSTVTTRTPKTTTTTTTPTTTGEAETGTTTATTPTTTSGPTGPGGGTQAPGEEAAQAGEAGGGASAGESPAAPAGGQEAVK